MNERITENIFKKILKDNDYYKKNISIDEQQVSKTSKYYDVFNEASKNKTKNKGFPEFFIELKEYDINIVVECKYENNKHSSIKLDKPKKYAVDGAIWYSTFLRNIKNSKTIAIGVSGYNKNNLLIDIYCYENNRLIKIFENLKTIFIPLDFYLIYENLKKNIKIEEFQKIATKIHKDFHNAKSLVSENSLIVSAILIALNNNDFRNSYITIEKQPALAKFLIDSLKNELENNNVNKINVNSIITRIKFIESHTILKEGKHNLRYFIDILKNKIYKYMKYEIKNIYIDEIGYFYSEFLKYTGSGDGKALGIILTPYHICELFVELANVNKKSKVIDITAGTGGFLVASLSKMFSLSPTKEEKQIIKEHNLIGFEVKSNIYALLLSNMIIRNDGKSNTYNESCFGYSSKEINKKWKPNIGMINPPYAQLEKEWEFVIHMLDSLEFGSKGIAIVPTSICWNKENEQLRKKILAKHTLKGVFGMKHDLFGPASTINTNILIFEANKTHNNENYVYFAQWHNDGLVRKKGSIVWLDKNDKWKKIKKKWIFDFENKIENKYACNKKIKKPSFKPEDYIKNDFNDFSLELIKIKIESYICLLLKDDLIKINEKFVKKTEKIIKFPKIKLENLFHIKKGKSIDVKFRKPGKIPYVGASMNNNGINEYIKPIEKMTIIKKNTISIGSQGQTGAGTTFYQPYEYVASGTIITLIPKFNMSIKVGIYISALLETNKFLFNFGNKVSCEILKNLEIPLPFKRKSLNINSKKIEDIVDSVSISKFISI